MPLNHPSQRPYSWLYSGRSLASVLAAGSLVLTLAACGSSDSSNEAESGSSSSSHSASASASTSNSAAGQSSSQQGSTSPDASESSADPDTAKDGPQPEENYEGAEQLKSAPTIAADSSEAKDLSNLLNSHDSMLGKVKPAPQQDNGSEDSQDSSNPDTQRQNLDEEITNAINEFATGEAAAEYTAAASEYAVNGWHTEGSTSIAGNPRMTEITYKDQPARLLEVCIDSSNVKTKDKDGNELPADNTPSRSLNIYTMVQQDGKWKIAQHDHPNNPDC